MRSDKKKIQINSKVKEKIHVLCGHVLEKKKNIYIYNLYER